jgi:cytochrome P450 family 135
MPGPGLPPLAQAAAYHRDPLGVLRRARDRYGPVFTLRVTSPVVFVADPAAVEPVMHAGRAGVARRVILPLASRRSLFGSDEEEHRALRREIEPRFRELDEALIAAIAREHIATWPRDVPFRLLPRMRSLATEVFGRVILGLASSAEYVAAVRRMLRTPGNPPIPVPGNALSARAFEHRAGPLIRLLEQAGFDSDRWLVVIAAGQEPPAIALTNVAYELARHPEHELSEAFTSEVLRLRPSASAVLRELTSELEVAGVSLPAGTTVALPSPLLHRDPAAFPEPDALRPGRPTEGVPYFPFGGGARRCVGEPLARALLRTVLPLVPRLRPAWPREERMVVRGTVLVPHRSAVVRF